MPIKSVVCIFTLSYKYLYIHRRSRTFSCSYRRLQLRSWYLVVPKCRIYMLVASKFIQNQLWGIMVDRCKSVYIHFFKVISHAASDKLHVRSWLVLKKQAHVISNLEFEHKEWIFPSFTYYIYLWLVSLSSEIDHLCRFLKPRPAKYGYLRFLFYPNP